MQSVHRLPLIACTLLLLGCATSSPPLTLHSNATPPPLALHYNATATEHTSFTESNRGPLLAELKKSWTGELSLRRGTSPSRRVSFDTLDDADLVVLAALYVASDKKRAGAEFDQLVWLEGIGHIPVTIRVGMAAEISLHYATQPFEPFSEPTADDLAMAATLTQFQSATATWKTFEKPAVVTALKLLTTNERELMHGRPFIRHQSPETVPADSTTRASGQGTTAARHVVSGCQAYIEVFNSAFESDKFEFVGTPLAPLRGSSRTILHEIGHAIHHEPLRQVQCRFKTLSEKVSAMIDQYNAQVALYNEKVQARDPATAKLGALLKVMSTEISEQKERQQELRDLIDEYHDTGGPVITAYLNVLDNAAAPTEYGRSSPEEAFADSFSLYKADSEALKRISPKILAWFEQGGHLRAIRLEP